jgi:hypothetical protein
MPREKIAAMVAAMMEELERMHQVVQEAFDRRGPIFGRGELPPAFAAKAILNSW